MLQVKVDEVVKYLDVAHLDARVVNQSLTDQIDILVDVDCYAFCCHFLCRLKLLVFVFL